MLSQCFSTFYFHVPTFLTNSEYSIFPKIPTFQGKKRFFVITIKKSFFGYNSLNINISTKRTIFQITLKMSFNALISKNINIRGRTFLRCTILPKCPNISTFSGEFVFLDHFVHILVNISISSKRIHFEKSPYTFGFQLRVFQELLVSLIHLLQI